MIPLAQKRQKNVCTISFIKYEKAGIFACNLF